MTKPNELDKAFDLAEQIWSLLQNEQSNDVAVALSIVSAQNIAFATKTSDHSVDVYFEKFIRMISVELNILEAP